MMTSSARIRRGFSRIGVALAAVFTIVTVSGGTAITVDHWRQLDREYEQVQCVAAWKENHTAEVAQVIPPPPPGFTILTSSIGCPGPKYEVAFQEAARLVSEGSSAPRLKALGSTALGTVAIAAIAVLIWLAFNGLGWVLAGFAKD
jgi:hypothetical protein